MFAEFERRRKPNTDAIAAMALENYVEMRETVLDPAYRRKKAEAEALQKQDPGFHPALFDGDVPSGDSVSRCSAQERSRVAALRPASP